MNGLLFKPAYSLSSISVRITTLI